MEVTKRVSNIMKDPELQKKLAYINVDDEYNNRVLKEAMKRFKDVEECLILSGNPNSEITPSWLNWAFNSVSRERSASEKRRKQWPYTWYFHLKVLRTLDAPLPFLTRRNAAK
jgi:hypothetical protein